jgi:hypothetical protein
MARGKPRGETAMERHAAEVAARSKGMTIEELNAAAAQQAPPEELIPRAPVPTWGPPEPLSPLGLYFNHLAGPSHQAAWSCLEHIAIVSAANGTGKTTLLLAEAIAFFMNCHPTRKRTRPVNILVLAPSRQQLAQVYTPRILERSELECPDSFAPELKRIAERPFLDLSCIRAKPGSRGVQTPDIAWVPGGGERGVSVIHHEDGSRIQFHITGVSTSWERIESSNFDAIFRDEAMGNKNLGDTLRSRLRQSWDDSAISGGGFLKWYFSELKPNAEAIDSVQRAKRGDDFHAYLGLNIHDNKAVSSKTRDEIGSTMSKAAAEIRMHGTRSMFNDMMIFANHLSRERHILPQHHEPSERANLWCAWDPGMRHPYGLLFGCVEPEFPQRLIIWAYMEEVGKTIDHQANVIAGLLDGRFLTGFCYDPAGAPSRDYGSGRKKWELLDEALRVRGVKIKRGMEPAPNAYDITLSLMWTYLQPDPANIAAPPLLVMNPPSPQSPGLDTFVEGLYRYQWKDASNHTLSREAVLAEDDEACSCARYLVGMQPRWVDHGLNPRTSGTVYGPTGLPYPMKPIMDPLADDPSLPEAERRQRSMLRQSKDTFRWWKGQNRRRIQPWGASR